MTEETEGSTIQRRSVLKTAAALGGMSAISIPETVHADSAIVVEQGGECYRVEPITYDDASIENFYRYSSASAHTPADLERSDFSHLFLYENSEGLYLVALHDEIYDTTGGAVTFGFEGLPDGAWAIRDDSGDFETGGCEWDDCVDWAWLDENTDGGAYRIDDSSFDVTIHPSFNEEAGRAPLSPGELRSWCFLSGDADAPTSISLDMDAPLRIHTGEPSCGSVAAPGFECPKVDVVVQPCTDEPIRPCPGEEVTVAIEGTPQLDPSAIDVSSLRFGSPDVVDVGDGASPTGDGELADVVPCEGDGTDDLVVDFAADGTGFSEGDRRGKLVGETTDGFSFVAYATVTVELPDVEMNVSPQFFPDRNWVSLPSETVSILVEDTAELDASTIEVDSLQFGAPELVAGGTAASALEARTVDDGLLVRFSLEDTGLDLPTRETGITALFARLAGTTTDGSCFGATDYITIGWREEVDFIPDRIPVAIDVKPCNEQNTIKSATDAPGRGGGNGGSSKAAGGVIPVAIRGDEDPVGDVPFYRDGTRVLYDPASTVDVSSLRFGEPDTVDAGGGGVPAHDGHETDVVPCDGDGIDDLLVHFSVDGTGFVEGDDRGKLVGETVDGVPFVAYDPVRIV